MWARTSTQGHNMAGAVALWCATRMRDGDFAKTIPAVVHFFTQIVPDLVHLMELGQLVAHEIEAAGRQRGQGVQNNGRARHA